MSLIEAKAAELWPETFFCKNTWYLSPYVTLWIAIKWMFVVRVSPIANARRLLPPNNVLHLELITSSLWTNLIVLDWRTSLIEKQADISVEPRLVPPPFETFIDGAPRMHTQKAHARVQTSTHKWVSVHVRAPWNLHLPSVHSQAGAANCTAPQTILSHTHRQITSLF